MTYTRLNKSQLVELVEKLESETLQAKLAVVKKEAILLGKDVMKAIKFTYELGARTRKLLKR